MSFLSSVPKRRRWLALAILALALGVRLWDIRARALWFDEACEYWVATAPFSELAASARTGTGDPPLYTFLLHGWMQIGSGEVWLRLLSVLASVAGVAGVMVLAQMFAGPAAALCAGVLLAVLPADVRYAQDVGQYGFVPAVVAWNLVCLINIWRHGTWRWVLGWAATALAGSYLYYGTVFPIAGAFLCVVIESIFRRNVRARRATGTALALYLAGLVPILITYLPTQLARVIQSGGTNTGAPGGAKGIAGILGHKWQMACELIAFQFTGWPHTVIPAVVVVAPVVFIMVIAIRKSPRLLIWFAVAINLYAAADALGVFPMGYRWGLILTPLIICAIAVGLVAAMATRAKWAMFAVLAALVAVCVVSLPNRTLHDRTHRDMPAAWPETEDMRVVADYWMEHRAPDQPTYVYYGAAPAFAYYTREHAPREGLPSTWHLACWHDAAQPGFCRQDGIYYGRWARALDVRAKVDHVFDSIGRPESFWVVFSHTVPGDEGDMVSAFRREHYRVDAAVEAVNSSACLLVRER
jgi:uncharacterized membrane protein